MDLTLLFPSAATLATHFRRHPRRPFSCRSSLTGNPSHVTSLAESLQAETLETLEWSRVCYALSSFTSTSMATSTAISASIPIGATLHESRDLLSQTTAAFNLPRPLDFSGIDDVSCVVDSAKSGELLSIGELCRVKNTLRSAKRLFDQLVECCGDFPERNPLLEILQSCNFLVELEQKIEFCVDCSLSTVLDRASDDLKTIRSERRKNMDALESLTKSISYQVFQAGGIDQPMVTNRRSRMCVGVKASHRSLLPGAVVLNVSSSGATYFMEPKEAMNLNNMEVRLANSEKDEERAILSLLTSELRNSAEHVNYLLDRVKEIDLAVARAGYAKWLDGVCPSLDPVTSNEALLVDIESIQDPLLLESYVESLKDVHSENSGQVDDKGIGITLLRDLPNDAPNFPVPIAIRIQRGTRVVIISGPNAGGKTASMKTLGLASLMSKAGLYLPAKGVPKLPWFDLILADIGDHQSLEQSLSTFSGHILRIGKILEVVSKHSLVLIDEIGSGTDPSEGVALSSSILQYLKDRVNLAVVTTHYADLSRLKETYAEFENASMEFCLDTLQPTYQVLWGCAGESNALRIARRIGFDNRIIDRAEKWLERLTPEKQSQRKGDLYLSLLEERNRMADRATLAASLHADVMHLYHEIKDEAHDLDWREKALIAKETQQLNNELAKVKSQIEDVIKEFENQLKLTDVNQYGSLLKKAEAAIGSIVTSHSPVMDLTSGNTEDLRTPQPGEQVHVKHLGGKVATVVEVSEDDGSVLVQSGKVRFRVDRSNVRAIEESSTARSSPGMKKQISRTPGSKNDISERKDGELSYGPMIQTSKNTIDLRGMRAEEASHTLDMAIAAKAPQSLLFIIHGMGTGAVKECVVDILKKHPRVEKFEQENPMNYGCTVAFIK